MKQSQNDTSHELHLIGVAEVHYWHGFDRMVNGMAEYYRTNPDYKVYFHIIGPLSGEREREEILPVVRNNHLEPYVIMHGPLHGEELDIQFERADFAIGSLGRHRSGITYIKTLKTVNMPHGDLLSHIQKRTRISIPCLMYGRFLLTNRQ